MADEALRWTEWPRTRWRAIGMGRFFRPFAAGMCLYAGVFSAICFLGGQRHWEAVLFAAGVGATLRLCLGILPTNVELTPHVLRWESGTWRDECRVKSIGSVNFAIVRGVLRLRVQLSSQSNRGRWVTLAAPLRCEARIRAILEPRSDAVEGEQGSLNVPAIPAQPIPLDYRPNTTRVTGLFPLGLVTMAIGLYGIWLDVRMIMSGKRAPMWFWSLMFGLTAILLVVGIWGMRRGIRRD